VFNLFRKNDSYGYLAIQGSTREQVGMIVGKLERGDCLSMASELGCDARKMIGILFVGGLQKLKR
jgi:hypothetical protein